MAKQKFKKISELTEDEIMEAVEDGRLIFDDKAFIKHFEENMPAEQKEDPLFIAYKASTKPEEERTYQERIYYKIFDTAFNLIHEMTGGYDDGEEHEPEPFVSKAEPAANAAFDSFRDHVDKLHQEYEEMTGRKFAKPKWRKE